MRKDIIGHWARANGLDISEERYAALARYQARVLAVNKYMNLTAITDDADFAVKHIIDSLTLLPHIGCDININIVDIGTGAGFPGLVLRIMRDDIKLTLLDSTLKRVIFLRETTDMLGFSDVVCVHARAEEFSKTHREAFDICTARAVAGMDKLIGYALPLIKKGGIFLAMKGHDIKDETEKAKPALKKYGGVIEKIEITEIAEDLKHSIVVIRKK